MDYTDEMDYTNGEWKCNLLDDGKWFEMPLLNTKRSFAAASMTSKGFLVTGGRGGYRSHQSTEFFADGEWVSGPELPRILFGHCQVTVGSHAYVFGEYLSKVTNQ